MLTHIWNNLFSNAIKFNSEGGKILLTLKKKNQYAVITVSDNGIGMSCDIKEHIFEKFYQGDSSRSTQGNGLGLALVKRVIDISEGNITVESEIGKGTTFTVTLPLK